MTAQQAKQEFINRNVGLLGRLFGVIHDRDEMFIMGLDELESQIKVTRGNLAMRRLIDREDEDFNSLEHDDDD